LIAHTDKTSDPVNLNSEQELSYRKQIARQLRTQYVNVYSIPVTLKSRSRDTQDHWKWCRSIDHIWLSTGRPS